MYSFLDYSTRKLTVKPLESLACLDDKKGRVRRRVYAHLLYPAKEGPQLCGFLMGNSAGTLKVFGITKSVISESDSGENHLKLKVELSWGTFKSSALDNPNEKLLKPEDFFSEDGKYSKFCTFKKTFETTFDQQVLIKKVVECEAHIIYNTTYNTSGLRQQMGEDNSDQWIGSVILLESTIGTYLNKKVIKAYREGYRFCDSDFKEDPVRHKPMLVKDFGKVPLTGMTAAQEKKVSKILPGYGSIKKDGMRGWWCPDSKTLRSRAGKVLGRLPALTEMLKAHPWSGRILLDGELFIPGEHLETILHIIKSPDSPRKDEIQFLLHDSVVDKNYDALMGERINNCKSYISLVRDRIVSYPFYTEFLEKVEALDQYLITDSASLDDLYLSALEEGQEGVVFKTVDSPYMQTVTSKRSDSVVKLKPVYSEEFLILQAVVDKNSKGEELISFICENNKTSADGGVKTFKVVPSWDVPTRKKELEKVLKVGLSTFFKVEKVWLTVEFRSRSLASLPQHAVGKAFRDLNNME